MPDLKRVGKVEPAFANFLHDAHQVSVVKMVALCPHLPYTRGVHADWRANDRKPSLISPIHEAHQNGWYEPLASHQPLFLNNKSLHELSIDFLPNQRYTHFFDDYTIRNLGASFYFYCFIITKPHKSDFLSVIVEIKWNCLVGPIVLCPSTNKC